MIILYIVFGLWALFTSLFQTWQDTRNSYDYHQYAQGIARLIPDNVKNICLFVTPDPYFELIKDKNKNVYEYIYGASDRVNREAFLDNCDAMVFNRTKEGVQVIGAGVADYISLRKSKIISYHHGVYPVAIVVMKK